MTKKIMSVSVEPEIHDEVKKVSKRRGTSLSMYVENLLQQALKLNVNDDPVVIGKPIDEEGKPVYTWVDEKVIPVVLKIPSVIKSDSEKLSQWLQIQMNGILKAFAKKT